MKVALTHTFDRRERERLAQFLGRPGELATREELVAFVHQSVNRRLAEITTTPAHERPKS